MQNLNDFIPQLVALRKELHHNPEISGKEIETGRLVAGFCSQFNPTHILGKIGKTGIAIVFEGLRPGKTILLRADMDALAIEEEIDVPYGSQRKKVSHKCGHDGHMAILAGMAFMLHHHPLHQGRVILLFQPEEENGKGALRVINDPAFSTIKPDYVFALHNLPGFNHHSIILREGVFAMASEGISIHLKGHASHAAYPEQGISPAGAIADLIRKIPRLAEDQRHYLHRVFATVTYARLGRFGFGTYPGHAELACTLRASRNEDLATLLDQVTRLVTRTAAQQLLEEEVRRHDPFIATVNNADAVASIRKVANRHHFETIEASEPFRWSEDFGQFTSRIPGAIFGLGAGENQSDLHTSYYDFPDEIIKTGVTMFFGLVQDLLHD